MNILVVDENRVRRLQIVDALQKKRHTVEHCAASNDFLSALDKSKPERVVVDVPTWKKGKAIYAYFQVGKKLEKVPVLFYNSYEGFTLEGQRAPHEKDRILMDHVKVEDIAMALD